MHRVSIGLRCFEIAFILVLFVITVKKKNQKNLIILEVLMFLSSCIFIVFEELLILYRFNDDSGTQLGGICLSVGESSLIYSLFMVHWHFIWRYHIASFDLKEFVEKTTFNRKEWINKVVVTASVLFYISGTLYLTISKKTLVSDI